MCGGRAVLDGQLPGCDNLGDGDEGAAPAARHRDGIGLRREDNSRERDVGVRRVEVEGVVPDAKDRFFEMIKQMLMMVLKQWL